MKFENRTRHLIRLLPSDGTIIEIPPSGVVSGVIPQFGTNPFGYVNGIPLINTTFHFGEELSVYGIDVDNLDPDTVYIVSTITAQVVRRSNVVSPATIDEWVVRYTDDYEIASQSSYPIYDPSRRGMVYGVKALQSFSEWRIQ